MSLRNLTSAELETLRTIFANQRHTPSYLTDIKTQDSLLTLLTGYGEKLALSNNCKGEYYQEDLLALLTASSKITACTSDTCYFVLVVDDSGACSFESDLLKDAMTQLQAKLDYCDERMVIVPIALSYESDNESHSNSLIIDRQEKTIELFEPNGALSYYECKGQFSDTFIVHSFQHYIPDLAHYDYIAPLDYCPVEGPQVQQERRSDCEEEGYCLVFSSLYIHLRLLEPDVPREKVIQRLLSYSPLVLLNIILRYMTLWEGVLPPRPSSLYLGLAFRKLMAMSPYRPEQLLTLL